MIRFQIGDAVRVVGLPTCEWRGTLGGVVKTVERDSQDGEGTATQECAVQFPDARRWFLANHLIRAVADKPIRFFRSEVLERWKDLSADDVIVLNGTRDELIALLQERYGFRLKRAAAEVEAFLYELHERIRIATDVYAEDAPPAEGGRALKVPA